MSTELVRKFRLFWTLCASLVLLVLTNAYAEGVDRSLPNGSNAYDVLLSGKDIGILAVILLAFMGSIVKINSMSSRSSERIAFANNDAVRSLAKSIDAMKEAQIAANLVSANNVHNMLQTLAGKPCLAEEVVREAIKDTMRKAHMPISVGADIKEPT